MARESLAKAKNREELVRIANSFGYKRSLTALLLNNGGETKEG
ncbi:hypothetical protein J622_03082 [Acinetobacter sp. 1564232]|jgi:hypothetical protein|nr:hypothetical protein J622_03082 [Acinetobacter sp. 1564232]